MLIKAELTALSSGTLACKARVSVDRHCDICTSLLIAELLYLG